MTTINRRTTIDAPADKVWSALADIGGVATWNPNLKSARLTSDQEQGEGTTRECRLAPMGVVQERVTEWTDGKMLTIEIFDFKNIPGMRHAVAVFNLEPSGDGGAGTEVTMSMDYQVGLGPVGAGMNAMMMKRQFTGSVVDLLAGLKYHVETGRPVERGAELPTAAVVAA